MMARKKSAARKLVGVLFARPGITPQKKRYARKVVRVIRKGGLL